MTKATMSRDGIKRFTIRVDFRISANEIAVGVSKHYEMVGSWPTSRQTALESTRMLLFTDGIYQIKYWNELTHSDASHDDVMAHTYKLFPELRKDEKNNHE